MSFCTLPAGSVFTLPKTAILIPQPPNISACHAELQPSLSAGVGNKRSGWDSVKSTAGKDSAPFILGHLPTEHLLLTLAGTNPMEILSITFPKQLREVRHNMVHMKLKV